MAATTEIYTLSLHDALPISGMDLVKEVSSFLKRARHNPDLRFTYTA